MRRLGNILLSCGHKIGNQVKLESWGIANQSQENQLGTGQGWGGNRVGVGWDQDKGWGENRTVEPVRNRTGIGWEQSRVRVRTGQENQLGTGQG